MIRDEIRSSEEIKEQMRGEFKSAREQFLAEASSFELKLDAFAERAERAIEWLLALTLGWPMPRNMQDEILQG